MRLLPLGVGLAVCLHAWGEPAREGAKPLRPATDQVEPLSSGAADASRGASARPTSPDDASLERERAEDERRATESKEKMKSRPGYRDNVPTPRG